MSNRRSATSHSNTPSEKENDDNINSAERKTESLQWELSLEPNKNPADNTRQNPPKTQNLRCLRYLLNKYPIHL